MAKKYQKVSIAHARDFRHKLKPNNPSIETSTENIPELPAAKTSIHRSGDLATNPINIDWEYDCGYEGGVNREDSETEYQPGSSESSDARDIESLDELSGDELEWNLQQQSELLAELKTLAGTRPSPYAQISNLKTTGQWTKVEKNRTLGYNGHSVHSKQWKEKAARDQKEFWKQAQTSWAIAISGY
jgi:hypothetical protein